MGRDTSKKYVDIWRVKVSRMKELMWLRKKEKERKKAQLTAASLCVGPDGNIGTGRKFGHLVGEHGYRGAEHSFTVGEHVHRGAEHNARGVDHGVKGAMHDAKRAEYVKRGPKYGRAGAGLGHNSMPMHQKSRRRGGKKLNKLRLSWAKLRKLELIEAFW